MNVVGGEGVGEPYDAEQENHAWMNFAIAYVASGTSPVALQKLHVDDAASLLEKTIAMIWHPKQPLNSVVAAGWRVAGAVTLLVSNICELVLRVHNNVVT
jgi:hypothetical protein